MDSSPNTQLLDLLTQISKWIENPNGPKNSSIFRSCLELLDPNRTTYEERIPFSSLDVKNLGAYMTRVGVDPDFSVRMSEKICNHDVWENRFQRKNYQQVAVMVVSFVQNDLKEAFEVPKPLQPDDGIRTRTYAVEQFFQALSVFLDSENLSSSGITSVLNELGSFCTIFSDRLFEAAESEQSVQCLWAQFEGLVNQVGSFVHSSTFSPYQEFVRRIDTFIAERITCLKDGITEFSETWQSSTNSKVVYGDVNSFFIIDSLLQDLVDLLNRRHNPKVNEVKGLIEQLHSSLMLSWSMVKEHVERKEFKEIAVQIKDMCYGAEYAINSFLVKVGATPLWYVTVRLTSIIHRIERLTGDRMLELMDGIGVRAARVPESIGAGQSVRGSRGNEEDSIMIGFEKEEESILDQLLGGTTDLQIVSIIGTPGLGKTTLAKKLYSHPSVRDRFDKRSWCVISQVYERRSLLVEILEGLGAEVRNDMDEASFALEIHKTLMHRRYFITLDDVWSSEAWDDLRPCFPNDGNGSRILFTSRNMNVVPMGSVTNVLPFLSDDECWELFEKKVFNGATCPPKLEVIGKSIVTKCKGLPLVVVVLAGILSSIPTEPNTWREVERNIDAHIFSDQNSVMHILDLSYRHLSEQLRPCFLYFAAFPEDGEIPVKKLKQLWIAEGFVQRKGEKRKECIAEEYFEELVRKSLIMVTTKQWDGRTKSCVVHDLLHEMCVRIAEKEMFLRKTYSEHWKGDQKYARIAFEYSPAYEHRLHPYGPLITRSLFGPMYYGHISVTGMVLLRVLKLGKGISRSNNVTGLESTTINLRYMEMRKVRMEQILTQESLEYLLITREVRLSSQLFSKLMKLRYIKSNEVRLDHNFDTSQSENSLEFLSKFWICSKRDEQLLKYSPHLHRLKCCYKYKGRKRVRNFFDLSFLTLLDSFSVDGETMYGSKTIKFPLNVRKLTLTWSGLFSWKDISIIAALPNLEVLKIENHAFVGDKWETRDEFKKLRFLKLHSSDLRQWNVESTEYFPVLEQLHMRDCTLLKEIPSEIGNIVTLRLIHVSSCHRDSSICKSARRIQQEQLDDYGNEDLEVITP